MRFKRAGFLTKVVVLVLLIYLAIALLNQWSVIQSVQTQQSELQSQVDDQRLENQRLKEAIENSDDPAMLEQVARDKGYVKQDEELYIDIAN